jgi:predicted dehydrogenase/nucleoside-diphosphate-sugar epimerase
MADEPLRVALIGAGYIAPWHAEAVRATGRARLTAVVDPARDAAEALAGGYGAKAFGSVEEMIAAGVADAVHVLTPPAYHRDIAVRCLEAGLHVLVEKPAALSPGDVSAMGEAARKAGRHLAVSHNFLALPGYERLKAMVAEGRLGRVSAADIHWAFPLPPLRSGPYGLWLLRETGNLLLELGPHPFAFAVDLFGPLTVQAMVTGQPVPIPGGGERPQSWRILARAGDVDVTIHLSLVETHDDRSVTLRGSSGMARFDHAADVLTVSLDNTGDLVVNPLRHELSLAGQHLREGVRNAARQAVSLNRRAPYGLSIQRTVAAFQEGIRSGRADDRFVAGQAVVVMQGIADALALLPPQAAPAVVTGSPRPEVMVIGGTGFIGRNLTRRLAARGTHVRVVSRGARGPFDDIADRVETVAVPLTDAGALTEAMRGMRAVINLARSVETSWQGALDHDIAVQVRIAEAAHAAGVRRLVYTGTIASYDMSDPARTITEETPFGDLSARNLYARAKAECEARLTGFAAESGLPLVIARPGIVVGPGGPLQHWGIGRWHGAGAVRLWGNGRNVLPFVLADDTSDALIAMTEVEGIEGRSFNLTGDPMLTARDWFDAIHRRLGARIRVSSGNLTALWVADHGKSLLKRRVLRKAGAEAASLADWRSRAHLSRFSNAGAKAVLGWRPEADRERFLDRALDPVTLFGF